LYVGGGFYYNTKTKGAEGIQAVPHLEFWKTMPGLVKDGVTFSQAKYQEKYGDGAPYIKPAPPLMKENGNGVDEESPIFKPADSYGATPDAETPTKKKKKKVKSSTSKGDSPEKGEDGEKKKKKKRKKKPEPALLADAKE